MDTYTREGKLYGIPFASGASYLFYNKNAFDEAGLPYPTTNWDDPTWTWEAWVDIAKQLTKNYGNPDASTVAMSASGRQTPSTGCSTLTCIRRKPTRPVSSRKARPIPRTRSWRTSRRRIGLESRLLRLRRSPTP